jgi:hypothetical protein
MKLFLLLSFSILNAQQIFSQKWKDLKAKDKVARVNITDLIPSPDGYISVGFEYLIKNDVSVFVDAGYTFFSIPNENVIAKNKGLFIRPGFRYYPKKRYFLEIDIEIFIKKITTTVTDWIGRNCVNEVPSYYEYKTFRFSKNSPTFNIKIGTQKLLYKKYNCWLEPFIGIGIRFQNTYFINEENSCYNITNNTNQVVIINAKKEVVPTIPFGCRVIKKF